MAGFQAIYGSSVTLRILQRTTNREEALSLEKELVNGHYVRWGERPREQKLPIPDPME